MFQLLRWNENPNTHAVDVIVEYEFLEGKMERKPKMFPNPDEARKWINQERMTYGYAKLRAYILHKKILSERSFRWSSDEDRAKKLKSLEICLREIEAVKDYPLWSLCKLIHVMYSDLVNILPMEHHLTYKTAKSSLHDMWVFADEVLRPPERNGQA